jgi:hypothetical protein
MGQAENAGPIGGTGRINVKLSVGIAGKDRRVQMRSQAKAKK